MVGKTKRARAAPAQDKVVRTKAKKRTAKPALEEKDVVSPRKVSVKPRKAPEPEEEKSKEDPSDADESVKTCEEDTPQRPKKDGVSDDGSDEEENAPEVSKGAGEDEDDVVNFAELVGIGEGSDDSNDDGPMEALALSRLPGQVVSEIRNDEPALEKKLADIAIFAPPNGEKGSVPFWESLAVTMPSGGKLPDSLALDDLKREQRFAELATEAVHIGLDKLRKQKTKFRRPTDYFAQMVKTDAQMGKVKAKILHQKEKIESAEKRRNNREIAKNKKKVRSSQLQKEQEKKRKAKEEIEAFSRLRKQRLKERAGGSGPPGDEDDDAFPIELLEVEQLDDQNTFQSQADVASGKKKAWSRDTDKISTKNKTSHENKKNFGKGGRSSSAGKDGKGKLGVSGGVRKAKGSKKRLGRNRRKATAK